MHEDLITLTGLTAYGTHGVLDFEHREPQPFVVDVELTVWVERAMETDNISDTVSYAEIADAIVRVIEGEHCDLIETLAHRIVEAIRQPRILQTKVTVHKPSAPIPHTFSDVSVTVERPGELHESIADQITVIGLGSNLDNPREHLIQAITQLANYGVLRGLSSFYRSAPVLAEGQASQPAYWNAVVLMEAFEYPPNLLEILQRIEGEHGRERVERWGARTLDLDIIDFGGLVSDMPELTLPHPRAHQRRFVLEPWLEVDPDAVLSGIPVARLLETETGIDGRPVREQSLEKMDRLDIERIYELRDRAYANNHFVVANEFLGDADNGETGIVGDHAAYDGDAVEKTVDGEAEAVRS